MFDWILEHWLLTIALYVVASILASIFIGRVLALNKVTEAREYEIVVDEIQYEDDMKKVNLGDGDWRDQLERHLDADQQEPS